MPQCKDLFYSVKWSEEDQEFVGTCKEFPFLSWLDKDAVKAFEGIVKLTREISDTKNFEMKE